LEGDRCAFFWKVHHSLAAAEGFIHSLLSTTSLDSTLKKLEEQSVVSHRSKNSASLENNVPQQLWSKFPSFIAIIISFLWLVIHRVCLFGIVLCHDVYSSLLCVLPVMRKDLYYKGLQSYKKEMAWSDNVSIKDIKTVRTAFGGNLNDVMLTVVTRCIKSYLEDIDQRYDNYVSFIIPVSLREPSDWR
jgi:diacylglycerol O-acyltransferase